jgi:hypothetical protein
MIAVKKTPTWPENPLREAKDNIYCGYGAEENDRLHGLQADKLVLFI